MNDRLAQFQIEEAKTHLSAWVRELEKRNHGEYVMIVALWMDIGQMMGGSKSNRLELGKRFRELRDIYSDRNSGGNRRTSGHGTFEKECLQRGYRPRTVRDLIADYECFLSGKPSASEKRKARQEKKRLPSTAAGITEMQVRLAQFAIMLPLEVVERAYEVALELYDINPGGASKLRSAWEKAKPYYKEIDAILEQEEARTATVLPKSGEAKAWTSPYREDVPAPVGVIQ